MRVLDGFSESQTRERRGLFLAWALLLSSLHTPAWAQNVLELDRAAYAQQLHGFWLGQSIANWTGLVTEMDRVEAPFFTDADWGGIDEPAIWGKFVAHSSRREFFLLEPGRVWGADDDTDIEYIYLHLMSEADDPLLTSEQIRDGWLEHIYSNEEGPLSSTDFRPENYLWVSNETAYYLMKDQDLLPPATSEPANNPDASMIDAQLTTELFGLLAPGRPDVALDLAELPIRTTASGEAAAIARFYVYLHSLAATVDTECRRGAAAAQPCRAGGHRATRGRLRPAHVRVCCSRVCGEFGREPLGSHAGCRVPGVSDRRAGRLCVRPSL